MLQKEKNSLYFNKQYQVVTVSGTDSKDLIQRISTNDTKLVENDTFQTTLFLSDKGRLIDSYQYFKLDDTYFGIVSSYDTFNQWIDKYVFTEDITIAKTDFIMCDVILGEGITSLFDHDLKPGCVNIISYNSNHIYVFVEYSNHVKLLIPKEMSETILQNKSFAEIDESVFSQWRVNSLVGTFPNEYNDNFIPLEIGLVDHISFTKGCYIGQEIIARLDTYQKVTKYLAQIKTDKPLLTDESYIVKDESGKKLGVITTIGNYNQDGFYHLAVIHKSLCEENTPIIVVSEETQKEYSGCVDDALTDKTYYSP